MEFLILGPVEVRVGQEEVAIGGPRHRKALAALLLGANQIVSMHRLVSVVWNGDPPQTAIEQVQNCLSAVRRSLISAGLPPQALTRMPGGYRLALEDAGRGTPASVDLGCFLNHVHSARDRAGSGDLAGASVEMERGLGLWRGAALSGLDSIAFEPESRRLDDLRLSALQELAELRSALGDHPWAIAELARLSDEHPLSETLYALRIKALRAGGRRAEALAVFRTARKILRHELGLDPGQELCDLQRALLTEGHPRQEAHLTGPAAVRRARASARVPHLLPPDVADFTGRQAEAERLCGLLRGDPDASPRAAVVLAAVTGMAGIGKSALAIHVAHRVAHAYPDGQLYVDLRGTTGAPIDPGEALLRFLRMSGVDRPIPRSTVERAELYRSTLAGRRLLVVLDDAASEKQVRPLLPGSASCAVLITSRSALPALAGACHIPLDVFARDEAIELMSRIVGSRCLSGQSSDTVDIVRLCDGLPLAVRVAACWLKARPAWPAARLTALLRDEARRLDRLAIGDLSVRASLATSYHGMSDEARRLFRLLGVFHLSSLPAWLPAAVLEMTEGEAAVHVESLVDAHLLMAGAGPGGQFQYRFHGLVRLYARERALLEDDAGELARALRAAPVASATWRQDNRPS